MSNVEPANIENNDKKRKQGIVNKLINDLGGILVTSELLGTAVTYISKIDKKRRITPLINFLRETIPVALTSYKLYTSIKEYFTENNSNLYDNDTLKRKHLLNCDDIYSSEFNIGKEIILWLIQKPKTKDFSIMGFYDYNMEKVDSLDWTKECTFYILLKDNTTNIKGLIHVTFSLLSEEVFIRHSFMYTEDYSGGISDSFKDIIFKEFIANYNVSKNVIVYTRNGILCKKKEKVDYKINQFDIDSFLIEIKNSIELNKKRGYVFSGPPGTGKTSIISKIENEIDNVPFIYVAPNTLTYYEDMMAFFSFARSIKPSIIIFEDLDSYEDMEEKNNKVLSFFIESIDAINQENNGLIIIATVNDTSLIHDTLINRRGRFDKIFYVNSPKDREEVYSVLNVRYKKETGNNFPIDMIKIKGKFFRVILRKKFTQSDICEIIDNMLVLKKEITNDNLMESLKTLIQTQKSFKKSFKVRKKIVNL